MTIKTRSELKAENGADFPDNLTRQISPSDLRGQMNDTHDSMLMREDISLLDLGDSSVTVPGDGTRSLAEWIALSQPRSVISRDLNILYNSPLHGYGRQPEWTALGPTRDWSVYPHWTQLVLGAAPFATTNASKLVTCTHVAHRLITGQYVHFQDAVAVAGITIAGQYEVTVTGVDTYTFTHHLAAANATTTGGGSLVKSTIWTDQRDIFQNTGTTRYTKKASLAAVGIQQIPRIALVSGRTYATRLTLANVSAGSATVKLVNDNAGNGEVSAAASHSTNGTHTSTIVAAPGNTIVRIELSADFVGDLVGPIELRRVLEPVAGDSYLVTTADATGTWGGRANSIATYEDGMWMFLPPLAGQQAWVEDEKRFLSYDGSSWTSENPAILPDGADVFARWMGPPAGTPDSYAGTPWAAHSQGLMVQGHFAVFRKGGFNHSDQQPGMWFRDSFPNGSVSAGRRAGGGTPRGGVLGGWEVIVENDSPEIRMGQILTDSHGKAIDWMAGTTNGQGRIYSDGLGQHAISGAAAWRGRSAEIYFNDTKSGGEIAFRTVVAGGAQSTIDYAFKVSSQYPFSGGHTPLFIKFTDKGSFKQVDIVNPSTISAGGIDTTYKILVISNA